MNENINSILESMFPSNSYKEKYQKIGWMNKSKGKKTDVSQKIVHKIIDNTSWRKSNSLNFYNIM